MTHFQVISFRILLLLGIPIPIVEIQLPLDSIAMFAYSPFSHLVLKVSFKRSLCYSPSRLLVLSSPSVPSPAQP